LHDASTAALLGWFSVANAVIDVPLKQLWVEIPISLRYASPANDTRLVC
jgi:hypothetical protein